MWNELYNQNNQPTMQNINDFIHSKLWKELCSFIEDTYVVNPKLEYSKCSMQKGWNIKYKKNSKSICTLYPMDGYFIALIVIGNKIQLDTELVIPTCSTYIQQLYSKTPASSYGKWLMIEVRKRDVLKDVLKLIEIKLSLQSK